MNEPLPGGAGDDDTTGITQIVEWSADYETGIPLIDAQHRGLFGTINLLAWICDGGDTRFEHLPEVLDALCIYVRDHFETEEKMMEDAGYARVADHRQEHNLFVKRLLETLTRLPLSREEAYTLALYLQRWLVAHILTVDRLMAGDLIRAMGEAQDPAAEPGFTPTDPALATR